MPNPGPGSPSRGGRRRRGPARRGRGPAPRPRGHGARRAGAGRVLVHARVRVVVAADAPLPRLGPRGEHRLLAVAPHRPDEGRREDPGELLVGQGPGAGSSATASPSSRPASRQSATASRWRRASVGWPPPKRMPSPSSCTTNSRRGMAGSLGAEAPEDAGEVQQQARGGRRPRARTRATRGRGGGGSSRTLSTSTARSSPSGPPWWATTASSTPRAISSAGRPASPLSSPCRRSSPNITPRGAPR